MGAQGDVATVRLLDKATGQLFAACPLPHDKPLVTVRSTRSTSPSPSDHPPSTARGATTGASPAVGLTDSSIRLLRSQAVEAVVDSSRYFVLRVVDTTGAAVKDQVSSLGGAKSSLGDAKSSLGDAKSSLGDC